jgi:hypothetical protein
METALIHPSMSSQISPSLTSHHALTSRWNTMLLLKVCRIVSQMRGCFIKVGINHLKDFHSDDALVDILGNPCYWGAAWTCLKNTSMDIHKLPVLDFYFLSEYIQTSSGNLPMAHLHYLDRQSVTELQIGGAPSPLAEMEADLDRPPLTFLMVECQSFKYPLFMLINLPTHEALFITLPTNEERDIAQELWFQRIWKGVSNLYNWSKNFNVRPTILYSNWIKVCGPSRNGTIFHSFYTESSGAFLSRNLFLPLSYLPKMGMAEGWLWKAISAIISLPSRNMSRPLHQSGPTVQNIQRPLEANA